MSYDIPRKWAVNYIERALVVAKLSKDPSTKVGALLVRDNIVISDGYNGFPRGVPDKPEHLTDREMKLRLTVHAERNAILNAARIGVSTMDSTLVLAARTFTTTGSVVWGDAPCELCGIEIIQAGIKHIVFPSRENTPARWVENFGESYKRLVSVGIHLQEVDFQ
jgi:dCMP deaminase